MGIFDIVKCEYGYIGLDTLPKTVSSALCLEDDETVQEFLNEIGAVFANPEQWELESLKSIYYNPLLIKQDVILISESGRYRIPYLLIKHRRQRELVESRLDLLKSDYLKQVYKHLVKYALTKDLYFINSLCRLNSGGSPEFDSTVFAVLNRAFTADKLDQESLNEAVGILNGRKFDETHVYMQFVKQREAYACAGKSIYEDINHNQLKRNIILIHLESLSGEIYYNQLHNLPALEALAGKSLRLNNFYSSASSSCMSLIDLFFGNEFESDSFPVFDEMYLNQCRCKNMYHVFQENGYKVKGIGYKELKTEEINHFNLWSVPGQKYEWKDSYAEFISDIESFITDSGNQKPFALHIWNLMPHIGHNDMDTYKGQSYIERMDLSYASLDMTISHVISCLNRKGILGDTTVICYGDHGDDKWTRSMNYGCTHIIPPHLNVVKCPGFIYDSRIKPQIFNGIVSTIDIKNTALFLAGIENIEDFPYQGINIFKEKNRFAYSRSHLANQRANQIINSQWVARLNSFCDTEFKNKSFGIINHSYNMVVGKEGLEFFMHRNDPGSYNNLLSFFEMDEEGRICKFNNRGAWRGHFRSIMMADDQIYDIIRNYYILRDALIKRIELKNSLIQSEEKNLFDMKLFNITRQRGFV